MKPTTLLLCIPAILTISVTGTKVSSGSSEGRVTVSVENAPTEIRRLHSHLNRYSIAVPKGWSQVPEEIARQQFAPAMADNNLTYDIDSVFAVEFDDESLAYPYAIVQIIQYSKYGVKGALTKDDVQKVFNLVATQMRSQAAETEDVENMAELLPEKMQEIVSRMNLGRLYVDNKNMSFLLGCSMEVPNVGRIRSQTFGSFGGFAWAKVTFVCAESDWDCLRDECNLIMNSFHFDGPMDCERTPKKKSSFLEDLLVDLCVYGIIGGIVVAIGLVGGLVSKKSTKQGEGILSAAEDDRPIGAPENDMERTGPDSP